MPSPEKILKATVGSLLLVAISSIAMSEILGNAFLRTVGFGIFGGAVFLAFLPLMLLFVVPASEPIKKPQSGADDSAI